MTIFSVWPLWDYLNSQYWPSDINDGLYGPYKSVWLYLLHICSNFVVYFSSIYMWNCRLFSCGRTSLVFSRAKLPFVILYYCIYVLKSILFSLYRYDLIAPIYFPDHFLGLFVCFEYHAEYNLTFGSECRMYSFCSLPPCKVPSKKWGKNPLNFVILPWRVPKNFWICLDSERKL